MIATAPSPQLAPISRLEQFLIVGYGNEQHGDSAVGLTVAKQVADWHLSSVKTLSVPTLTPTIVSEMAQVGYVIFVSACRRRCAQTVQVDPIVLSNQEADPLSFSVDHCTPSVLLRLVKKLYNREPQSWLLQVAAESFEAKNVLSPVASDGCDRALRTIQQFFTTYQRSPWMQPRRVVQTPILQGQVA
ncbi:MAG: hydrogenase maturation protease [Merismopedia sp. SIO2A8]|nr:hydrogenase maturation protease [Merismopedia sp. SIO2A8]